MEKNRKVRSKDNKFPDLFEKNHLVRKSSNLRSDAKRSSRTGSKKVEVKSQAPHQRLQIPKKRPSSAFIKSNISQQPLKVLKQSRVVREETINRRSFLRPVTAPTFFKSAQRDPSGKSVLNTARLEKNALWRKKEEIKERKRAEIYAINNLLKLGFESDFRVFMNDQN